MALFNKVRPQAANLMGSFAELLLRQAQFPPSMDTSYTTLKVLDNACGSGTVTDKIMEALTGDQKQRLFLTCADLSDIMVNGMKEHIAASGWTQVDAVKADAQDTKFPASSFSHIFFSFGPMLLPDPFAGLRECYRILQPGGTLGFTTWQKVPWCADFRAGLTANPELPPLPEDSVMLKAFSYRDEAWDNVDDVKAHFQMHGFEDIQVECAWNTSRIESIDTIREMLPYSLDKAIEQVWTKDQMEKYQKAAGDAAVDYVAKKYNGGPVLWEWAAIIATGKKPL